jgi:hypothetical protein
LAAAFEAPVVDEIVAERHDILAHAVLVFKVNNGRGMHVGEVLEETYIQASGSSLFILNERRKLVMVTNKNEGPSKSDGPKTNWKSNLRSLINDAVIKSTLIENSMVDSKTCCRHNWSVVPRTSDLLKRVLRRCGKSREFLYLHADFCNCS